MPLPEFVQQHVDKILNDYGLTSVKDFIDYDFIYKPEMLQPLTQEIGPIDAWRIKE